LANHCKGNTGGTTDSFASFSFTDFTAGLTKEASEFDRERKFVDGLTSSEILESERVEENRIVDDESPMTDELVEEAFAKGMDRGRSEVMVALKEKVDQATFALKTAIEELGRVREKDVKQMEVETVRLSMAIAKKIIGAEVSRREVIAHVVKKAMQKVTDPRSLTLRINPKDSETLRELQESQSAIGDIPANFTLVEDESILQGGCIIETTLGDVDARIDQQIKLVEEQLSSGLPEIVS
jgi:flagellar assembly protein FliH